MLLVVKLLVGMIYVVSDVMYVVLSCVIECDMFVCVG